MDERPRSRGAETGAGRRVRIQPGAQPQGRGQGGFEDLPRGGERGLYGSSAENHDEFETVRERGGDILRGRGERFDSV